jgi:hypothetical protein
MGVTAGETAPKFDRATYHRNYMRDYMRKRREAGKDYQRKTTNPNYKGRPRDA